MDATHHYRVEIEWTGNTGTGTDTYTAYSRNHVIRGEHKIPIAASSDPAFRGDITRYNPEELLVASLSSCHMLWYLHLCSANGVIVTSYRDKATGIMEQAAGQEGQFASVTLYPDVIVKEKQMIGKALELHAMAHQKCYIANSCNFPVRHEPACMALD